MTDGTGWSFAYEEPAFQADTSAIFGFDYSAFGIPEAPNSQVGDAPTSGLQMKANLAQSVPNSLAAFPTGMNFTGNYVFQFDLWMNSIGPFPLGGDGSTEFGGGSVGFDNATTTSLSGAGFNVSGEGGSSRDYRLYAHNELQAFLTHLDPEMEDPVSDLFDPKMEYLPEIFTFTCPNNECGGDNADGNAYVQGLFPGLEPPQQQQDDYFLDQFGTTKPGSSAFQWMTVKFTVDTVAGTAFVQMTSDTSGQTADVGTFTLTNTYVNRTTIDTPLITTFEGNVSLLYRDPFASLVIDTALSFGVFDNVIITQLVPAGVPGDYNENGVVDAGDYTIWRDLLGQNVTLPNEDPGTTPGMVTQEDYDFWTSVFGNSGSGSLASSAVPEPSSWTLLFTALCGLLTSRRWK